LCIHLPQWPATRYLRRHPEHAGSPLAIIRSTGQRRVVVDVNDLAQTEGIRPGHSAAEARALCPHIVNVDWDPAADDRALCALGRWMNRFTPIVARGWKDEVDDAMPSVGSFVGATHASPAARASHAARGRRMRRPYKEPEPAALFLDLTGCERLFGSTVQIARHVRRALLRFGFRGRLAIAPTLGAAWAFATSSDKPALISTVKLTEAIKSLPVAALRLSPDIVSDLHRLGLHHVGQLLDISRGEFPSRFGSEILLRLDQLTGAVPEPLTGLITPAPVTARVGFEAPVEALENIWLVWEKLLALVLADLARRGHGVRQLRLTFTPDRGWGKPSVVRTIQLSRAHRDASTLLNLIRCECDRVDIEHGFTRFQLDVPLHEPVDESQTQLFERQYEQDALELEKLLQRLRGRLGPRTVVRPQLVESYIPECGWQPHQDESPGTTATLPHRPLTLLPMPQEIRVLCEPSDDRTGSPRQLMWNGQVHRLTHTVGPERIAGEWWRGHNRTRDYYDAQSHTGDRFWIFRVLKMLREDIAANWFLHGAF